MSRAVHQAGHEGLKVRLRVCIVSVQTAWVLGEQVARLRVCVILQGVSNQPRLLRGNWRTSGSALYCSVSTKPRRMDSMAACRCCGDPHPMPFRPPSSSSEFMAISAATPCA